MDLPLGSGSISVDLSDWNVTVAEPNGGGHVDVREAAAVALSNPVGTTAPSLSDVVDSTDKVAVVVTDKTRSVPDDVLLDVLVRELEAIGVGRDRLTVVVGLGLHEPMTRDELVAMLGPHADLAVNHDPAAVRRVGSVEGCPIEISERVATADVVLSTGVVEPHQYAGFSGGAKTVVIGAGGESQISYTHGPEMLSREGVRLGRIDGNPFREAIDHAGDHVDIDLCINLAHGPDGVLGVAAGEPRTVVSELASVARTALSVPVDETFDAVVCGLGAPKDANLYQATRAATYVGLGDYNPLRPRGCLVVPAALPDGAGRGTGERRFYDRLRAATDPNTLYEEMKTGYEPGAQRAFVVARLLRENDVYVTNSEAPGVVEQCLMHAAPDVTDALTDCTDVLVVPDAINTMLVGA